jgi:transposase
MSRKAQAPVLSRQTRRHFERIAKSHRKLGVHIERVRIVLYSSLGDTDAAIAKRLDITPATVGNWRKRYIAGGEAALFDLPRSGRPPKYPLFETAKAILETLSQPPPEGLVRWDGKALEKKLNINRHKIWRVLRELRICLDRHRSWCVSNDPHFARKAAAITELYLNPPKNSIVFSIDEKTSIQALARVLGYVRLKNGSVIRGYGSTYKRYGTQNLFAALNVATGKVFGEVTERKTRADFLKFMDHLIAKTPAGKDIHVIVDNYCIHKGCNDWLDRHPNVTFHFTPTYASWLNQIEIFFGILSRTVLRYASYYGTKELKKQLLAYIRYYNKTAKPFKWRKRDVAGSQLRNTLENFFDDTSIGRKFRLSDIAA